MLKFYTVRRRLLGVSTLLLTTLIPMSSVGLELMPQKRFFEQSPRLIDTTNSFANHNSSFATYKFTIKVPFDAGKALKAITIEQRENFLDTVTFKPSQSSASLANGQSLPLMAIGGEETPGKVSIVLEQPVYPGETVTIAVKPTKNPRIGGVYLFGITVYPEGENSEGLYLGSGRIHIDDH